jgi:hypothetical protein
MRALRQYGSIKRFNSLLKSGGFIFGRNLIRHLERRGNAPNRAGKAQWIRFEFGPQSLFNQRRRF